MRKALVGVALSFGLLLADGRALADGVFFVLVVEKGKAKVSSDAQRALLVWRDGKETLHLRSTYRGPAADFAWVIPVPARPEVKRSTWNAFKSAEKATRPEVSVLTYQVGWGLGCSAPATREARHAPAATGVRRLETLKIRELQVEVLAAREAGGLVAWLRGNGYAVGKKAEPVLNEYVKRKFFFVAVKMRESGLWKRLKTRDGSVSGGLTPLAISFKAEKPFYPLAISAISSAPENELLLLTVADRRLAPVEYVSAELTAGDVRQAIKTHPLKGLDLAPAIRAAGRRLGRPALVVECAADMDWTDQWHDRLVPAGRRRGRGTVRVTRFHAVLKPGEMKDITFEPAKKDRLLKGQFLIDLRGRGRGRAPRLPAGLALAGLALAAVPRRKARRTRRLRSLGMFLALAALCLL